MDTTPILQLDHPADTDPISSWPATLAAMAAQLDDKLPRFTWGVEHITFGAGSAGNADIVHHMTDAAGAALTPDICLAVQAREAYSMSVDPPTSTKFSVHCNSLSTGANAASQTFDVYWVAIKFGAGAPKNDHSSSW